MAPGPSSRSVHQRGDEQEWHQRAGQLEGEVDNLMQGHGAQRHREHRRFAAPVPAPKRTDDQPKQAEQKERGKGGALGQDAVQHEVLGEVLSYRHLRGLLQQDDRQRAGSLAEEHAVFQVRQDFKEHRKLEIFSPDERHPSELRLDGWQGEDRRHGDGDDDLEHEVAAPLGLHDMLLDSGRFSSSRSPNHGERADKDHPQQAGARGRQRQRDDVREQQGRHDALVQDRTQAHEARGGDREAHRQHACDVVRVDEREVTQLQPRLQRDQRGRPTRPSEVPNPSQHQWQDREPAPRSRDHGPNVVIREHQAGDHRERRRRQVQRCLKRCFCGRDRDRQVLKHREAKRGAARVTDGDRVGVDPGDQCARQGDHREQRPHAQRPPQPSVGIDDAAHRAKRDDAEPRHDAERGQGRQRFLAEAAGPERRDHDRKHQRDAGDAGADLFGAAARDCPLRLRFWAQRTAHGPLRLRVGLAHVDRPMLRPALSASPS